MRRHFKYIDPGRTTPKINILEAIQLLVRLWDAVSANTVKNCFRKAGISGETQVAIINDEDDLFENVNEVKSRGEVDRDITVHDYVNIDFEVCTNETSAIRDSILIYDFSEKEEETNKKSNDLPPKKSKLSEIPDTVELLECWSVFHNSGSQIRHIEEVCQTLFRKYTIFSKKFKDFVILQGKDLRRILFQRSISFFFSFVKNWL